MRTNLIMIIFIPLVFQIRPSSRASCHLKIRTTALDKNFTEVPEIAPRYICHLTPSTNPSHTHLPEQSSIKILFFVSHPCSVICSASLLIFCISVQNSSVLISLSYSFLSYFISNYSFIKQISFKYAN